MQCTYQVRCFEQVQAKSKDGSNIKTPIDSREVVVEQTTSQDTSHTSTRYTLDEYEAVGQENPPDLINTSFNTTHDFQKSISYTSYTNELNIHRSIDPTFHHRMDSIMYYTTLHMLVNNFIHDITTIKH